MDDDELALTRDLLLKSRYELAALRMVVQTMLVIYGDPKNIGSYNAEFIQDLRDNLRREISEDKESEEPEARLRRIWERGVQTALEGFFEPLTGGK